MDASPYGTCPRCGSPGVSRERRPNGNDKCALGHVYPSASLNSRVVKKVLPDGTKLEVAMSAIKAGDNFTLDDRGCAGATEDGTRVYTAMTDASLRNGVWGTDVES